MTTVKLDVPNEVESARVERSISAILASTRLCSIATVLYDDHEQPPMAWINNAYFAWSKDFSLFYLSELTTVHAKNVAANGTAAVAVADSQQTGEAGKRGLQLFGTCRLVVEKADVERALKSYGGRFGDFGAAFPDVASLESSGMNSRFFEVVIDSIKVFDEATFGSEVWVTATVERE